MIPRIKEISPQADYKLYITFDGGEKVIYDLNEDINQIPAFSVIKTENGLYENVQLDESRTCIFWSDMVDLHYAKLRINVQNLGNLKISTTSW